ncbi:MAG: deoxynucleoside kinase [Arenicella sp.]
MSIKILKSQQPMPFPAVAANADTVKPETPASQPAKYIAVEGPIGVGKSSLAKRLATTFNSELVLEKPAQNPFLQRFYRSPKQYALPTQLFFLFQRIRQLQALQQDDLFRSGRIADFMLDKDRLFAQVTLDDDEYRLYQQVYTNLNLEIRQPDLVIYLQAPVNVLQHRIHKRGIKYEQDMAADYLQRLSDAYTTFFHRYDDTSLLIVNATEINFVDEEMHYQALVKHIQTIGKGKNYFNPLVEAL